jgi:hypothetical protein
VITKKNRYLYEVKYRNTKYPYVLWELQIGGSYDGIHKRIAMIPKGSVITIKSSNIKRDLYGPEVLKVSGHLTFKGKQYNFTSSCTDGEYDQ